MCPPHHGLGAPEPAQPAYYFPDDQQAARSARARARRKEKKRSRDRDPGFRRLYDVQFRGQVTLHRAPVTACCAQHLLLYAQVQGIPVRYTASVFADRASERREAAAAHHLAEHRDHRG